MTPDELEKVSEMLRASEIVQPAGEDMNRVRNRSADAIDIDGEVRVEEDDALAKAEAADQVDELRVAAAAAGPKRTPSTETREDFIAMH